MAHFAAVARDHILRRLDQLQEDLVDYGATRYRAGHELGHAEGQTRGALSTLGAGMGSGRPLTPVN
jgi:hypothetical protein